MSSSISPPADTGAEAVTSSPPMAPQVYDLINRVPETYWRYVARHELYATLWRRYRQPRDSYRVLDVGCGSGELLSYLMKRNPMQPVGIDLFAGTLPYCKQRGIQALSIADATRLPFQDHRFDLVIAQDVIEHIDDDAAALAEIYRVCTPGGLALILVPAFEFLWSARDVQLGHYRRYTLPQLADRVQAAGFSLLWHSYTDLCLLPLLWAVVQLAPRTSEGLANLPDDAAPAAAGIANQLATAVSRAEAALAYRHGLPAGVSAVVLAQSSS